MSWIQLPLPPISDSHYSHPLLLFPQLITAWEIDGRNKRNQETLPQEKIRKLSNFDSNTYAWEFYV